MSHDQRFKDFFSIVIGSLIAITIALIVLAVMVGGKAQLAAVRTYPVYDEQVNERLKPAGRVILAGEEEPEAAGAVAAMPVPVSAPLSGPQVFNQACNACHGSGIGGAPKAGDKAAWGARIGKGTATLYKHAIEGFQGTAGFMPPKGGYVNLSDDEIKGAVDYMVGMAK